MRWSDERYVRVYTRDTPDSLARGWEARALLVEVMRKCDRAGLLDMGRSGPRGLAALVGMPLEVVERALPVLVDDGSVQVSGSVILVPNFMEAQEAPSSDAQRKREQRARARDQVARPVTNRDQTSQNVTGVPGTVTNGHAASQTVTPSCAVPSCADPETTLSPPRAREAAPEPEANPAALLAEAAVPSEPAPATPRDLGALHREIMRTVVLPVTCALLDELQRRGFEAEPPKPSAARAVERAVAEVGVQVAADRVMAVVEEDRRLGVVTRPWLGWHLEAISGSRKGAPSGKPKATAEASPRSAFGNGRVDL